MQWAARELLLCPPKTTWPLYAIGERRSTTGRIWRPTTNALKAPYLNAATYGYAALPLQTVLSFGIGSLGYLLWSIVMLRGQIFHRWVAILGRAACGRDSPTAEDGCDGEERGPARHRDRAAATLESARYP